MWSEVEGGSHSACPQRLRLNNRPAAQGLSITPLAGLSHVTVLHHYCTVPCLVLSIYNCIRGWQSARECSQPCKCIVLLVAASGVSHHSFKSWSIDLTTTCFLIKAKLLNSNIFSFPLIRSTSIFCIVS